MSHTQTRSTCLIYIQIMQTAYAHTRLYFLKPIHELWRLCEAIALVLLYMISISWGDFGTTRPMIQDTMMFGSHLFAAIEDITLSCQPRRSQHDSTRTSECAQLYRSLTLACVCSIADCAALVTESKHVADDTSDSMHAAFALLSGLIFASAVGRVIWFFGEYRAGPSGRHQHQYEVLTPSTPTGSTVSDSMLNTSRLNKPPGSGRSSRIGTSYDDSLDMRMPTTSRA